MNNFERKGKTIQEIREDKVRLEKYVSRLIKEFEKDCGVRVAASSSGYFSPSGDDDFKVYVDLNL